jgi:glycosyltransferase involved in cell wall biosynthesis
MRVLHLPEGGLPMMNLCKSLREHGVDATACHFYGNRFNFESDICLHLEEVPKHKRLAEIKKFFNTAVKEYDVFHFHFGGTFFPDKSDVKILHQAGKKMVAHHRGSDARILSIARKNNPYVQVKPEWTEEKIRKNLTKLSAYIDHAIALDAEIESYIKDYYKETHIIPHIVDLNRLKPKYPEAKPNPLVVHAPTRRNLKGTEFVLQAVQALEMKGIPFRFQLIEGKDHTETMKLLREADIVIDQLRIGTAGFFSTEAMALGKPVICYIREDLAEKYGSELPVIQASPANLTDRLEYLIQHPAEWKKLGEKGRAYTEKHHNAEHVINKFLDVYKKL